jgi:hypothetical protein
MYSLQTAFPQRTQTDHKTNKQFVLQTRAMCHSYIHHSYYFEQVMYSSTWLVQDLVTHASVVSLNIFCIKIN